MNWLTLGLMIVLVLWNRSESAAGGCLPSATVSGEHHSMHEAAQPAFEWVSKGAQAKSFFNPRVEFFFLVKLSASSWSPPGPRPGLDCCLPFRAAEVLVMFLRDYGPSWQGGLTQLLLICRLNFLFPHLAHQKNIIEVLWLWRPQSCSAWSSHQINGTNGPGKRR